MLLKLPFKTDITATKENVWKVVWSDTTYRIWTAFFSEGSYAISDWKEGAAIQFLSPSGEGLYSIIKKVVPNEVMSFQHVGRIKNFVEQPIDEETRKLSGSKETYYLKQEK